MPATVMITLVLVLTPMAFTAVGGGSGGGDGDAILTWSREGGFAGFCDQLVVDDGGIAVATRCGRREPEEVGRCRLDADERAKLARWYAELASFSWQRTDPATADAMTIRLHLTGRGDREVTPNERQRMLEVASDLFARASR